ncbi:MAG TPA: methyltransferase domain-containing protein, partial [Candidatus Sulfotelmatobacter sp.]|nr:methyltransferase domain-containing protein [Candidatus Sulfotelmatobacter sp.]
MRLLDAPVFGTLFRQPHDLPRIDKNALLFNFGQVNPCCFARADFQAYIEVEQLFIIASLFGRIRAMTHTDSEMADTMSSAVGNQAPRTTGIVLHSPIVYDLTVWLAFFGRERVFREKVLELARLMTGECVLDVGCGTGTLAIAAKRRLGPSGTVHGVDASPEMLARAQKKAKKAGVEISF